MLGLLSAARAGQTADNMAAEATKAVTIDKPSLNSLVLYFTFILWGSFCGVVIWACPHKKFNW
jgi:hypothetical protein